MINPIELLEQRLSDFCHLSGICCMNDDFPSLIDRLLMDYANLHSPNSCLDFLVFKLRSAIHNHRHSSCVCPDIYV